MYDISIIDLDALALVTGGRGEWTSYQARLRRQIRPDMTAKAYGAIAGAGKGGRDLAQRIFGKGAASEVDAVRGGEAIRGFIDGGDKLPEAMLHPF